jgi:ribosomal protein S18 acetylase RimI-like enzyme
MKVREATIQDADAIATVHFESWRAAHSDILPPDYVAQNSLDYRRQRWPDILSSSDGFHIVLEDDQGAVVGFSSLGPLRDHDNVLGDASELKAIYLLPEYQGAGHGRKLYDAMEKRARQFTKSMVLWVFAGNVSARRFYESLGFESDRSEIVRYETGTAKILRYVKQLS